MTKKQIVVNYLRRHHQTIRSQKEVCEKLHMSAPTVSAGFKAFRAEYQSRAVPEKESIVPRGRHDQAPLNEIANLLTEKFGPPSMHYNAGEFEIIIRKRI